MFERVHHMIQLVRFWYLSHVRNMNVLLPCVARDLNLSPYLVCVSSEDSGKTPQMCRLV